MNGGNLVAEVFKAHEIEAVFTLCGGHISPILTACDQAGIQVVDVRHEANAVFAADSLARITGKVGVAVVTAGPGLTNTITPVKNAQLAESPLLVIGGATATLLKGRGSLQDIDQMALMSPHVKFAASLRSTGEIIPTLERALSEAKSGVPGPVFVEIPIDLLYDEELVRNWYGAKSSQKDGSLMAKLMKWYLNRHVNKLFGDFPREIHIQPRIPICPYPGDLEAQETAHLLKKSRRPVMILGSQVMIHPGEIEDLQKALESLSIPLYLSGMARGLLGKNHPLWMRHCRREALKEADLVILAGVPVDFRLDYGRHIGHKAALVMVNLSGAELKRNRDITGRRRHSIRVLGDPLTFLVKLARMAHIPQDKWKEWKEILGQRETRREEEILQKSKEKLAEYMNPVKVCQELEKAIGEKAVLVADGGDFVGTASYIVRPRGPLTWLDPGVFGTLGVGAGFAMGAKLARPDHEVWILYGDGSCGYSIIEFDTFVRHKIPVIAVVGNDGAWNQIAREQKDILKSDLATKLTHAQYHKVASALGGKGILVDKEEDLPQALQRALKYYRQGHPVLVNCLLGQSDFRKGSISM
ncbi:MAG: thiamine pyrophosphate-binding protein [Planctomycetota bacterium]|nr:MAG: thiamine pyrophosphate-binding protein [Planctomycetota bacterium]